MSVFSGAIQVKNNTNGGFDTFMPITIMHNILLNDAGKSLDNVIPKVSEFICLDDTLIEPLSIQAFDVSEIISNNLCVSIMERIGSNSGINRHIDFFDPNIYSFDYTKLKLSLVAGYDNINYISINNDVDSTYVNGTPTNFMTTNYSHIDLTFCEKINSVSAYGGSTMLGGAKGVFLFSVDERKTWLYIDVNGVAQKYTGDINQDITVPCTLTSVSSYFTDLTRADLITKMGVLGLYPVSLDFLIQINEPDKTSSSFQIYPIQVSTLDNYRYKRASDEAFDVIKVSPTKILVKNNTSTERYINLSVLSKVII